MDFFLDEALKPWLLELNNFPSMEAASLDRYVNDPMIAEMFNIAGFHYTGKPSAKQKKVKTMSLSFYYWRIISGSRGRYLLNTFIAIADPLFLSFNSLVNEIILI